MNKLIVIDHANIMFKSIFAFRNNQAVPVTYLYLSQITGYLKKIGITLDDKIIVGIDYSSWRKEIYPEYKANRKALREKAEDADFWEEMFKEFNEFIPKLDICLPWNFVKIYNCEFDDLASFAVRYLNNYDEAVIISTDEDLHQLCAIPNVKIFSPYSKKYKDVTNPEAILLKKINKGCVVDNIIGVPKTQEEWQIRRTIVSLLTLPTHIEQLIRPVFESLPIKNMYINKIPYRSIREKIIQIYRLNEK